MGFDSGGDGSGPPTDGATQQDQRAPDASVSDGSGGMDQVGPPMPDASFDGSYPSEGVILCGGDNCHISSGDHCCASKMSSACVGPTDPCSGSPQYCDDTSDCPSGVCCFDGTSATCRSACALMDEQLCASPGPAECLGGKSCTGVDSTYPSDPMSFCQ